jgi:hypothetical protein
MKLVFTFCILLGVLENFFSQDTLITFDQPNNGTGPFIVPKKSLQIEFGTSYNETVGIKETYLPSLMVRVPFLKNSEWRFTLNYEPQSSVFIIDDVANNNDPIAIGFKKKIIKEKNIVPEVALMSNVFYPLQRLDQFEKNEINYDFWMLAQNSISNKSALNYCLAFTNANIRLKNSITYSLCYSYELINNFNIFIEYFGYRYLDLKINEFGFDFGATYEFGNRFQLDFCYYYNRDPINKLGFFSAGICANFKNKKLF